MTDDSTRPVAYLDHAATTPIHPEALAAMAEQAGRSGNASSLHGSGRATRRVVEESRETIAAALGARPSEVVFTSGGTESDNLALKGFYWARRKAEPSRRRILTTAIEHHAILDTAHWLATESEAEVELLGVGSIGFLDLEALRASIERDPTTVALISVMWANNEVGTVQPISDVQALAAEHAIPLHTDAVQALGNLPLDFATAGVDAMTITGHKIGGPFGVGALLVRREVELVPLLHGGGQERDVRSGTIDAPAIVGFAVATELAVKGQAEQATRLAGLRDELIARVLAVVPDAQVNGALGADRLPGNAHLSFWDAKAIRC
ncbi:MAG: cysteine desulfurase family protein [Nocardioidaceae bacterium]